jgi:ClpP class serine protease
MLNHVTNQIWAIREEWLFRIISIVQRHDEGYKFNNISETFKDTAKRLEPSLVAVYKDENGIPVSSEAFAKGNAFDKVATAEQRAVVGVVQVSGPMFKGANLMTEFSGASSMQGIARQIKDFDEDNSVESILLNIDSPGGTIDGLEMLANTIAHCKKLIVGYIDGTCASAAYIGVASQCDLIIAGGYTSQIGSLGTMLVHENQEEWFLQQGLKMTIIRASKSQSKNKLNPIEPLTEEVIQDVLRTMNPLNEWALNTIKGTRKIRKEDETLSGEMFSAEDAMERGLIDEIGTFDYAISRAAGEPKASIEQQQNSTGMKNTRKYLNKLLGKPEANAEVEEKTTAAETTTEKVEEKAEETTETKVEEKTEEKVEEKAEEKMEETTTEKVEETTEKTEEVEASYTDAELDMIEAKVANMEANIASHDAVVADLNSKIQVLQGQLASKDQIISAKDTSIAAYKDANEKLAKMTGSAILQPEKEVEKEENGKRGRSGEKRNPIAGFEGAADVMAKAKAIRDAQKVEA